MSDAMGGAVSPDRLKRGLNAIVTDLSQLQRSTKAQAIEFKDLGFSAADLGSRLELPEKQLQMLQQRMMQNQAAQAQIKALRDLGVQAGLTKLEIQKLGLELGVSQGNINKATGTSSMWSTLWASLMPVGGVAAALLALNMVKEGVIAVYDAGSKMERLNMSMTAISGTKAAAGETLAYLRSESDKAGVSFLETTDNYKSLLAAGSASGIAERDVRSLFSAVTEAGAVVGMSQEQQSRSLLALEQMISKGTVSTEELRRQLGENLPGAYSIAAKAMGVTTAQLSKMLEQGQIATKDFLPKFAQALREEFGAGLEDASNTGTAALNRLDSSWTQFKANIYQSQPVINALENLKSILDALGGSAPPSSPSPKNPGSSTGLDDLRAQKAKLEQDLADWQNVADKWANTAGAKGPSLKVEAIKKQIEAVNRELTNAYVAEGKNSPDISRPKDTKQQAADEADYMKVSADFAQKRLESAEKYSAVEAAIAIARLQGLGGGEFEIKQLQEQAQHAQAMLGYQKELVRAKLDPTIDAGEIGKSMGLENQRHAIVMANMAAEAKLTQADRMASMQVTLDKLHNITGYYDTIKALRAKADVDAKSQDPVAQANAFIQRDAAIWQQEQARYQTYAQNVLAIQAELAANAKEMAGLTISYDPKAALSAQISATEIAGRQKDLELTKQLADAKRDLARSQKEAETDADPILAQEIQRQQEYVALLQKQKNANKDITAARVDELKASRDAETGKKKALDDYTEHARNAAEQSKEMWSNSFSATENSLTEMLVKGKTDISSWLQAIESEMVKTQFVRPVLGGVSSALSSGSPFSWIGKMTSGIFHGGGTVGVTAAPTRDVSPALFVGAPRFHDGLKSDEYPAILQTGEDVISRADKARLRNAAGAGATVVNIPLTVNNNASETVQATARQVQTAQGGPSLEVTIDKIVAQRMGAPGSATSKALRTNFGISRQVTPR